MSRSDAEAVETPSASESMTERSVGSSGTSVEFANPESRQDVGLGRYLHILGFGRNGTRMIPEWLVPFFALIAVVAYFSVTGGSRFLSLSNGNFLLQQTAVIAIPAFGTTLVIIAGSIDLSVGAMVGLTGAVAALVAQNDGLVLGLLAGLAVGIAAGAANGFVFAVLKVPSFMVTLGTLSIATGIQVGVAQNPITVSSSFSSLGQMPGIAILMAASFAISVVLLHYTSFGRRAVAIGGQERVASAVGCQCHPHQGLTVRLRRIYGRSGRPRADGSRWFRDSDAGTGFELTAITAVVLGGTPLTGGIGNMLNTVVGALILSILLNGMIINGITSQVQLVVQGIVLIAAIMVSLDRRKIGVIK